MNSVAFIDYGTETLALCAAPPNWRDPIKLSVGLPGDVTQSLLKTESRRRFATSNRYTLEHLFETDNAADSTDLRKWLERLKIETVAVPLWTDGVILAADIDPNDTNLLIDGELPVRSGAEWLIVSDDGRTFEIVVVTGLTDLAITLGAPGVEFFWPAGTMMYPLMFGRLDDQRSQFDSPSDETLSGTLKFLENSPFARKLTTRFMPAQLAGSHVPGFETYKLWTLEPDWSDGPRDWSESDVLRKKIPATIAREEQQYQYQNWNRSGQDVPFTLAGRDQIAQAEFFFNERGGTALPFFIPSFLGDLRLAADAASGATTFEIEDSRYEVASYDDKPSNAFLCFIDDTGIYPMRIDLVDATTITPAIPLAKDFKAAGTQVCFLKLARFVDPSIDWEYPTDNVARARLKFIEVPDEYVTPAPVLPPPAYLFHFTEKTPVPNEWYFTSYEQSIVYGGKTYLPAPFSFDRYKAARDLTDPFTLSSWGGSFAGNPLNQFIPFVLNATMTLTVVRVNRDNPDDLTARILYYGDVMNLDTTGPDWTANLQPFGRRLEMKFPRFNYQIPDNFSQFTPPTQLDPNLYQSVGMIATLSGFTVTLSGLGTQSGWYNNGTLTTGTGANFERRAILTSSGVGTVQTLTIDRPLIRAVIGQAVTLLPGYDQTREQCESKFFNERCFGGHPFMPDTNQILSSNDIKTPSGGKKG